MKRSRFWLLIATVAIVVVAGAATAAFVTLRPPHAPQPATNVVSYWMPPELSGYKPRIEAFGRSRSLVFTPSSREAADIILTTRGQTGSLPVYTKETGSPAKLQTGLVVAPEKQIAGYLTVERTANTTHNRLAKLMPALATTLSEPEPGRTWRLDALGDIMIGRTVYLKMLQHDLDHPFKKYSAALSSADLTIANLENAFSDSRAVVTSGGMSFVSPSKAAAGLKSSGIDAVSLANNHAFNGGAGGYLDTITTLDTLGIAHFGGGKTESEARKPYTATIKGTKVALLGYSSITGSTAATATTPGMAYLDMAPWGTLNDEQLQRMEQDIRTAKATADLVLVYYHWGKEYTHEANPDQRTVAHRAIDAGADVILGAHPHWVQGIEWYHDRLIAYSLGNFIFDQEWAPQTKQGALLQITFSGAAITSAQLSPYTISDYNQPAPATPEVAQSILQDIFTHSWWPQ